MKLDLILEILQLDLLTPEIASLHKFGKFTLLNNLGLIQQTPKFDLINLEDP